MQTLTLQSLHSSLSEFINILHLLRSKPTEFNFQTECKHTKAVYLLLPAKQTQQVENIT